MPSVQETRSKKLDLESAIREKLEAYEEQYGVTVDRIRLRRHKTFDGGSTLTSVEIEVQL